VVGIAKEFKHQIYIYIRRLGVSEAFLIPQSPSRSFFSGGVDLLAFGSDFS